MAGPYTLMTNNQEEGEEKEEKEGEEKEEKKKSRKKEIWLRRGRKI